MVTTGEKDLMLKTEKYWELLYTHNKQQNNAEWLAIVKCKISYRTVQQSEQTKFIIRNNKKRTGKKII